MPVLTLCSAARAAGRRREQLAAHRFRRGRSRERSYNLCGRVVHLSRDGAREAGSRAGAATRAVRFLLLYGCAHDARICCGSVCCYRGTHGQEFHVVAHAL